MSQIFRIIFNLAECVYELLQLIGLGGLLVLVLLLHLRVLEGLGQVVDQDLLKK